MGVMLELSAMVLWLTLYGIMSKRKERLKKRKRIANESARLRMKANGANMPRCLLRGALFDYPGGIAGFLEDALSKGARRRENPKVL